jgi:hypothetical protein
MREPTNPPNMPVDTVVETYRRSAIVRLARDLRHDSDRIFGWVGIMVVLLGLVLAATPRRIGDGGEYMAMAINVAGLHRPALSPEQLVTVSAELDSLGGGYQNLSLSQPVLVADDGRQEFAHFWVYPAMAAPFVAVARELGIHPNYGFVVLHLILLGIAAWLLTGRIGVIGTWFVVLSPIVWWSDKVHSEVFTFSLLAMALAVFDRRPGIAMVALALASTQNPPIAATLPLAAVIAVGSRPSLLRMPTFWLAGAVAVAIAALHPMYYLARLGVFTPQVLNGGTSFRVPTVKEFVAPVSDLNLGLLWNFPLLVPVVVVALAVLWRAYRWGAFTPSILLAGSMAIVLLAAFAQTTNLNSGGTPGPTRYMLWLIPLAIPVLAQAFATIPSFSRRLLPVAMVSVALSCTFYVPTIPEWYFAPSPVASLVWSQVPWLDNPIPEVFLERTTQVDGAATRPAAFPGCSKVLLVGGAWPNECPPFGTAPAACYETGVVCYANRIGPDRYQFSRP